MRYQMMPTFMMCIGFQNSWNVRKKELESNESMMMFRMLRKFYKIERPCNLSDDCVTYMHQSILASLCTIYFWS